MIRPQMRGRAGVSALLRRQGQRPCDARIAFPAIEPDNQDKEPEARPGEGDDGEGDDDEGQGCLDVDQGHKGVVDDSAIGGGDHADSRAENRADQRSESGDKQARSDRDQETHEHIPAQFVRSEGVRPRPAKEKWGFEARAKIAGDVGRPDKEAGEQRDDKKTSKERQGAEHDTGCLRRPWHCLGLEHYRRPPCRTRGSSQP